jgi:hypothetical protein
LTQLIENRLFLNFEGYIASLSNEQKIGSPRKLKYTDTYLDIIKYFKDDFQMEFDNLPTGDLTPELENAFKIITADFYNKLALSWSQLFNEEIEIVAQKLKYHFGFPEKKLDRLRNNKESNKFFKWIIWPLIHTTHILFLTTVLAFLIGIVVFLIKIIQFKICS